MEKKLKSSIALTTYNGEKYLLTQLESLARQSRLPDELVICDDGSKDSTLEILESFQRSAPFSVRIERNQKNLGYSQNFAKALSLCAGDILFLCDQDDLWLPNKISDFMARFETDAALSALFADSLIVNNDLEPQQSFFEMNLFSREERALVRAGEAWRIFLKRNIVAGHALAIRKADLPWLLPIPEKIIHDAWLIALLAFSSEVDFLDGTYVKYRQHQNQNIGVISGSVLSRLQARWKRAAERKPEDLERELRFYEELLARLKQRESAKYLNRLEAKIEWLKKRKNFSPFRLARIPRIASDLGAYQEFDNGMASAIKDLLGAG